MKAQMATPNRTGTSQFSPGRRRARRLRSVRLAGLAAALLLFSSRADVAGQDVSFSISPPGGPGETEVIVEVRGLPAGRIVALGFGGIGSPHEILGEGTTSPDGTFSLTDTIPSWVQANRSYLFYVAFADQRPIAFSGPFLVTGLDGVVEVSGRITDEGVTCTAMRGLDDELYTLAGSIGSAAPGDEVVVTATIAEASICMQGITLVVQELDEATPSG